MNLGFVELLAGERAAATARYEESAMRLTKESLDAWAGIGDVGGIAWCLNAIALLGAQSDAETAALLVGKADRLLEDAEHVRGGSRRRGDARGPHRAAST